MKTKTKSKPRARKMFANYYGDFVACHNTRCSAMREGDHHEQFIAIPVAVIPLDDVAALVKKATAAFLVEDRKPESWTLDDCMTAALTAIGVLPKQKKGGRK